MSALTFETLSTELTQALAEQNDTPPNTTARCTLGRDKVMVLVEYPLNSQQSEPLAGETLDWLEQELRQQFDTAGLPEAAADLAEAGSEISVQLFLKHISELKPFTMRSFIWKVDDGFDDLFGPTNDARRSGVEGSSKSAQRQRTLAEGDQSAAGSSRSGQSSSVSSTATSTVPRPDPTSAMPFFHSALEHEPKDTSSDETGDTDISATGISAIKTGVLPEDIAAEQPAFASAISESQEPASETPVLEAPELEVIEPAAPFDEDGLPAELDDEDLHLEIEPISDSDAVLPMEAATDSLLEEDMALTLPGESPEFEPEEFSLPTVDLPGCSSAEMSSAHADFFTIDSSSAVLPESREISELDITDFDGDTSLSDYNLPDAETNSVAAEGQTLDELEPIAFELIGHQSIADQELADDLTIGSTETEAFAEAVITDAEFDQDGLYGDEPLDDGEGSDDEDSDEEDLYEEKAYEEALYEEEAYEEDSAYYLEGEAEGEDPIETVAHVDEGEVQRQRAQWAQQSQSNPWVFAGALGFVVVGVLGFVLTRPCTFGSCDRIQTAQEIGDGALSDLRIDSSLAAVKDAKAQLKRSAGLLSPIPIWSPYYRQAQTVLPGYENQVRSLDYVTSAQDKAYKAALASQDPPHPVSHWQQIAQDWESASKTLEAVPADSPVRELADSKLTEYRANRATILVRIDSEAKAEVGIRQAQKAASLGKKQIEAAGSLEDWEDALASWESAVDNLSQIPQGTNAHGEAQKLLPEYLKTLEDVRANTEVERNASRSLFQAKQLAAAAQKAETEEQWSAAIENWQSASRQLQDIPSQTLAHAEAEALKGLYATSFSEADNNFQVALRFQPVEPNFFAVCGMAGTQKCTYSVRSGNVRLDLFQGYDTVIDQSITPPDQRAVEASAPQLVGQSNQMLQDITMLSTQAQVPVELYNAQGEFLARYRPDLSGFTR